MNGTDKWAASLFQKMASTSVPQVRRETVREKWRRSIGWPLGREHYRDPLSRQHAVCDPADPDCLVHEDRFNPDRGPRQAVLHFIVDFLPLPLRRMRRGQGRIKRAR